MTAIRISILACMFIGFLVPASELGAAPDDTAHPFILWNKKDIASIRARIEKHAWAREELERLRQWRGYGSVHRNLFLIMVTGDKKIAQDETKDLLSFIGAKIDSRPWSDHYLSALRYDVLHDSLTPDQRRRIEETFRKHIRYEIDKDRKAYTRNNWLPNMQWPRKNGAMLMAVAMRDEKLIREIFAARGGWKWYFDEYICDGHFYNEEFGKHYSNIGEMLLWCRGLERLGLDELGYRYVGKGASGGATMKKYLQSIHMVGYPRVDLGTERHHYPKMTMGDAKGKTAFPGYMFQHNIVKGCLSDGTGGNNRFMGANMNGRDHKNRKVEKMLTPMWFEIAHAKWPEARFDYFLAQMREPNQDKYYPSLFWGLDPIDPKEVAPPKAPSGVYRQRGIAMLRWNESEAYWSSPDPAVSLRLATPYVHEVPDVFAIIGFYAFGRPIYVNRQVSAGYAGTDPGWSNSIRSHASVQVDGMEPRRIGELPARKDFSTLAKFTAVRGKEIYPGVDQTRALLLTKEYLLDVFALSANRPRTYQWAVHTAGHACPDNPDQWAPTRHQVGAIFDLSREKSCVTGNTWSVTATQITAGAHPKLSAFGSRWFNSDKRIGVRMTMLGQEGTIAYTGLGPVCGGTKERILHGAAEPGAVTIAAARSKADTAFIALHEPFRGRARIASMQQLERRRDAVLVRIGGPTDSINDLAMLRWGDSAEKEITLTGAGGRFAFSSYALLRTTANQIDIVGGMTAFHIPWSESKPKLMINGKDASAELRDGQLIYGRPLSPAGMKTHSPTPATSTAPISVRWPTDIVRLATGGRARTIVHLRNISVTKSVTGSLRLAHSKGLTVKPSKIALGNFAPGAEKNVTIELSAEAGGPPSLGELRLVSEAPSQFAAQAAVLRISQGVTAERSQLWPRDFAWTVYAPRYIMKFHYLENTAAALIRDPLGLRRTAGGAFRPEVLTLQKDDRRREKWIPMKLGGFQAFKPVERADSDGEKFLADMGRHPHGYSSPFEWRFYEDWAIVKLRNPTSKTVIYGWSPGKRFRHPGMNANIAKAKSPGVEMYVTGGRIVKDRPKGGAPVAGAFIRWAGFQYGQAAFYPPGAVMTKQGLVSQPGDKPTAMTFCTDKEFGALVKKWKALGELIYVKPWSQGDMGK